MRSSEILMKAANLVDGERDRVHGSKQVNFDNISSLWTAYLGRTISDVDVANMMSLMKIARTKTGEHNLDDYIDAAGYAAIAGELDSDNS